MMRNYPADAGDREEASRLNAAPWMIELLRLNPEYNSWGPGEDSMTAPTEEGGSWAASLLFRSWSEFNRDGWLNDLNEVVNFHFEIRRDSRLCPTCGGNGYAPEAQRVVNSFYQHMNPEGVEWCDAITEDELDTLKEGGRMPPDAQLEAVNAANRRRSRVGLGHDAINRAILTRTRLQRLGLPVHCPNCAGHGTEFTAERAHVNLILWVLHPRKGCSRGLQIERLQESDLPAVFAFLRAAAERNAARFNRIPAAAAEERR